MRQEFEVPSNISKTKEKRILHPTSNIPKNRRRGILGESHQNSRMSKYYNYTSLIMQISDPIKYYTLSAIIGLLAFSIGGQVSTVGATNETLKMCNQNKNECKFKYDILMYTETGKVPSPTVVTVSEAKK